MGYVWTCLKNSEWKNSPDISIIFEMHKLKTNIFQPKKRGLDEAGFSLIELVVAAAISGAVVLTAGDLIIESKRQETAQNEKFWLEARSLEMANAISTQSGWIETLALNPDMSCFTASTGCPDARTPQKLKINLSGTEVDGTKETIGMNSRGDFCNTFSEADGDRDCPYGIRMSWQAVCEGDACLNPQPKAIFSFRKKLPDQDLKELPAFTRTVFRDPKLDTLSETCAGIGGTLTGSSCAVTSLSNLCNTSAGLYAVGFDTTGKVICDSVPSAECAANQVLTGFDAQGAPICSFACTP